eukprot:TRINITY_DN313_c0_g1_i1.p1 TRINITY_DN313_c0_g1~~TRINITY_DN313_c0_g1_i1.p1  ORF type:complete len:633 (+),score=169.24 TRINITY_DN313_c0_g1_i1:199-2097(+)
MYNFKKIPVVPSAKDFVDIVLSKTHSKTPTVVHKGYKISRIRAFYQRKVKFTQDTIQEKISEILIEFPRVDDIHPFYSDLINVLYDKDHYKVALSQLNIVKHQSETISRDYVRLLKYGDSLYRCKQLKRAALGRMMTLVKKLQSSLAYLEQVRQHLSRLPSIDANAHTLLVTGFPNVGKSSFMNKITRAEVEVQPYAFTTKSLFVGHTDFKYNRWQVIDTPGILDHALDERNTIEMQAITALAHLHACILYFMDLSGTCGYSVDAQLSLFKNISPLFSQKPLVVVINKTDLRRLEDLDEAERESILSTVRQCNATVLQMSCNLDDGVANVKNTACDLLLEKKIGFVQAKNAFSQLENRLHVAKPSVRDDRARPASIPDTVLQQRKLGRALTDEEREERKKQKRVVEIMNDIEEPNSLVGLDVRKHWQLEDSEAAYDVIPELMDGHNIADWIDPDIEQRLLELEQEEEELILRELEHNADAQAELEKEDFQLDAVTREAVQIVREKVRVLQVERAVKRSNSKQRSADPRIAAATIRADARVGRKRTRSTSVTPEEAGATERSQSRKRARSSTPQPASGLNSASAKVRAISLARKHLSKRASQGMRGEGDHWIPNMKPKHLFTGKRGLGTADRR